MNKYKKNANKKNMYLYKKFGKKANGIKEENSINCGMKINIFRRKRQI